MLPFATTSAIVGKSGLLSNITHLGIDFNIAFGFRDSHTTIHNALMNIHTERHAGSHRSAPRQCPVSSSGHFVDLPQIAT